MKSEFWNKSVFNFFRRTYPSEKTIFFSIKKSNCAFHAKNIECTPELIGSKITLWPVEHKHELLIYSNHSNLSHLPIGDISIDVLPKKYISDRYSLKSSIIGVEGEKIIICNKIEVKDKIYLIEKIIDQDILKINKIVKKPLNSSVRFFMSNDFQWNSRVFLVFGDIKELQKQLQQKKDWESFKELVFWLEDSEGEKISIENHTRKTDLIKVLRNQISGFKVTLKYRKGQRSLTSSKGGYYAWDCIY